jgi:DNA-directed RNA polymerase subunit F
MKNTNPNMPSRLSALTYAVKEWFQIHGKVVFTFAVFNILLIVFCVVYWGVGLPMYPLNTVDTTSTASPNWFHGSNMLDGFNADLSKIISKFHTMQWYIFSLAVYMAYILRDMYYAQISALFQVYEETERSNNILRDMYSSQLQSQRLLREGVVDLNRIYNLIKYEPEALTRVVQGVQAIKDNIDEKCDGFEDLLKKIIRIMPEHPIDIRDAVYSFQDMTEDLLTKIKREIRMLRIDSANDGEVKEEMVELSASSSEASGAEESEVPVVPTITPRQKRGRKPNVSGSTSSSSSSSTPLLSSTRLGSRRANEMIQQATH